MQSTIYKQRLYGVIGAMLVVATPNLVAAQDSPVQQSDPVVRNADQAWVGESNLYRYANRVHAVVRTTDLDPGSTVTAWWRIYNRPQFCAVPYDCATSDLSNPRVMGSQLHATGFVVDKSDGSATVVASLYRTAARAEHGQRLDDSFTEGYLKGRGLRRPLHAEVELILVNHGRVADPDVDGFDAAVAQLLTPSGTQLECTVPSTEPVGREFRCGGIQRIDHPGID